MLTPHYEIQLSFEERQRLEALLRAGKTEQRVAQRAALILLAHVGTNNQQIAQQLQTSRNWVQKWRKRFAQYELPQPLPGKEPDPFGRLQALEDLPRSGRPTVFSPSGAPSGGGPGVPRRAAARLRRVLPLQYARPGALAGRTR
jgi:Homeodomain-like domain